MTGVDEHVITLKTRLAIVGRSGMGKSSFINTILQKKPGDNGYAQTGCGNTTLEHKTYMHPKSNNLTVLDTPGFGTYNMPNDKFLKFLEKIDLKTFDLVLIIFETVITEAEVWIADVLTSLNLPFCLINCKIDYSIEHAKKSNKATSPVDEVEKLRDKIKTDMETNPLLKTADLYLISNKKEYFQYGDWVKLLRFIASKTSDDGIECLPSFLPVLFPNTIYGKCNQMEKRIMYAAAIAGLVAALPLPVLNLSVALGTVVHESHLYQDEFWLNTDFAKNENTKVTNSKNFIEIAIFVFIAGTAALLSQLPLFCPVFGSLVFGITTVAAVKHHLKKKLDETRKKALTLYRKVEIPKKKTIN